MGSESYLTNKSPLDCEVIKRPSPNRNPSKRIQKTAAI
jgi:hypothetical protein